MTRILSGGAWAHCHADGTSHPVEALENKSSMSVTEGGGEGAGVSKIARPPEALVTEW